MNQLHRRGGEELDRETNEMGFSQEPNLLKTWTAISLVDRLSIALMAAGITLVSIGVTLSMMSSATRFESILPSFGILVFMGGFTLFSQERKPLGTFMTYMWIFAFAILAALTGYSALGSVIKWP